MNAGMKGLLMKDWLLIMKQLRFLILLTGCGAAMSLSFEPGVVVVYLTMIGAMVAVSTISYDEQENGYAFLLTLPVSRKDYVREKYCFCFGWALICMTAGTLLCLLLNVVSGKAQMSTLADTVLSSAAGTGVGFLAFLALMIPLRIKYGAEQARVAQYIIFGGIIGVAFVFSRLAGKDGDAGRFIADMENRLSGPAAGVILLALVIAGLIVSLKISERIMERKEF